MEDQFGGCPECGKNDGYRNIYRQHFFYCDEHRTVWIAGSNLFSNWRDESSRDWVENYEYLEHYTLVEEGADGKTLGEAISIGTLIPPAAPPSEPSNL